MNKTCFLAAIVVVFLVQFAARSQSGDLPRFEVAGEFTTMERDAFFERRTDPGFGGRFTYNLNRVFSLEAAGFFFPKGCSDCDDPGRATEVLGGVKVGKRFNNWGVFAKVRPGVFHHDSHFGGPVTCLNLLCPFPTEPFEIKLTHFALDLGGVVEFYPSKRIVTRFDVGDTIIHIPSRRRNFVQFDPSTGGFNLIPFTVPSRTTHNFQFMTSIGFRF